MISACHTHAAVHHPCASRSVFRVLTAEEIEQTLAVGHEIRGLEVKGPGAPEKRLFAKVARAALSMGNLRDGGHVVIGIADEAPEKCLPGLSHTDLTAWLKFDEISRALANYADPPLQIEIEQRTLSTGANVAVIQVFEFADVPHVCARDYDDVLRDGALYVRTRRLPETAEVPNSVEMREVLDLATEKALRAFLRTAERAGGALTAQAGPLTPPTDETEFELQRRAAWDG